MHKSVQLLITSGFCTGRRTKKRDIMETDDAEKAERRVCGFGETVESGKNFEEMCANS